MRKKLFIVESSVIGPQYLSKAAAELDLESIFLTKLTNQEGDALKGLVNSNFIVCDTEDPKQLIDVISRFKKTEIAGVVTFLDSRLDLIAKICARLKVPGIDPAVLRLKDKGAVARLIPEYSPRTIEFHCDKIPFRKIDSLLKDNANGLIVKPRFLAGGKGFRWVRNRQDLNGLSQEIHKLPKGLKPHLMIAQTKAPGELVSFEGFVIEGNTTVIGVTGRRKIGSTESAFLFPYDEYLPKKSLDFCHEAINALVLRAHFRTGFFHTEFMVHQDGNVLIDCNFGRPGGANIAEILSSAFDLDPVTFYKNVLSIQLYGKPSIPALSWKKPPRRSLGIAYGVAASTRVLGIQGPKIFQSTHTMAVNRGANVPAMGASNWAWVGLLAGRPSQVLSDLYQLKILTERGSESPCYSME